MVAFSKIVEVGEPFLQILRHLHAAAIYRLMRVSKTFRAAVEAARPNLFNIYGQLAHYFADPNDFRHMQSRTGAIISGSFALQFFRRLQWTGSDLDLYVEKAARHEVGQWLLNNGYTYAPRPAMVHDITHEELAPAQHTDYLTAIEHLADAPVNGEGYLHGVAGVLDFMRYVEGDLEGRKVQLVVVEECPMATIMNFHSSKLPSYFFVPC